MVAASGLAREALAVVEATGSHRLVGVVDDSPELAGLHVGGTRVLGSLERVLEHPDAELLLCVGRGAGRERLAARLSVLGVAADRFATVIHPSVSVPAGCSVGPGSVLLAQVVLTTDVRIGRHVVVMPNVTLTHDDVLDDFSTLAAGVSLGGSVRVGARAYLGMNSCVRERCTVGADAVLGMGAALLTDLPEAETWFGVPARSPGRGVDGAPSATRHEQRSMTKGTDG